MKSPMKNADNSAKEFDIKSESENVLYPSIDSIKDALSRSDSVTLRKQIKSLSKSEATITLLNFSQSSDLAAVLDLLLQRDADPFSLDSTGYSAAHYLALRGELSLLNQILSLSSATSLLSGRETLLHAACKSNSIPTIIGVLSRAHQLNIHRMLLLKTDAIGDTAFDSPVDTSFRPAIRSAIAEWSAVHGLPLKSILLHHPECLEHLPRSFGSQGDCAWEAPDRIAKVVERLASSQTLTLTSSFPPASHHHLIPIHSQEYLSVLSEISSSLTPVSLTPALQKAMLDMSDENCKDVDTSDSSFSAGGLKAAQRAAGAVVEAVETVTGSLARNAFCLVRPPGHHAGPSGMVSTGCGFCVLNNAAIGAVHAQGILSKKLKRKARIAIVDFDCHHGNGTEEVVRMLNGGVEDTASSGLPLQSLPYLYASVHLYDPSCYFPHSGGEDAAAVNVFNCPVRPSWSQKNSMCFLPRGSRNTSKVADGEESLKARRAGFWKAAYSKSGGFTERTEPLEDSNSYRSFEAAMQERLFPILRSYSPDLIILSAGFDAGSGDCGNCISGVGEGGAFLTPRNFQELTRGLMRVANQCCEGRIVSVLEGGYGAMRKVSRKRSSSGEDGCIPGNCGASCKSKWFMDREPFVQCVLAHVRGLSE